MEPTCLDTSLNLNVDPSSVHMVSLFSHTNNISFHGFCKHQKYVACIYQILFNLLVESVTLKILCAGWGFGGRVAETEW